MLYFNYISIQLEKKKSSLAQRHAPLQRCPHPTLLNRRIQKTALIVYQCRRTLKSCPSPRAFLRWVRSILEMHSVQLLQPYNFTSFNAPRHQPADLNTWGHFSITFLYANFHFRDYFGDNMNLNSIQLN